MRLAYYDERVIERMAAVSVVPNRNTIMLSIAYGVALAGEAQIVAAAVHAGDHYVYPDCRPQFIEAFDAMERRAVEGFGDPSSRLPVPFIGNAGINRAPGRKRQLRRYGPHRPNV